MNREDARRRIRALRTITEEAGASTAEVETAAGLTRRIAARFSVEACDEPFAPRPSLASSSAAWDYWRWLLGEFGIDARQFRNRAMGKIGVDRQVVINLGSGEWQVQRIFADGRETIARQRGLETLRSYLRRNAPRSYSLFA